MRTIDKVKGLSVLVFLIVLVVFVVMILFVVHSGLIWAAIQIMSMPGGIWKYFTALLVLNLLVVFDRRLITAVRKELKTNKPGFYYYKLKRFFGMEGKSKEQAEPEKVR